MNRNDWQLVRGLMTGIAMAAIAVVIQVVSATTNKGASVAKLSGKVYERDGITEVIGKGGTEWRIVLVDEDGDTVDGFAVKYNGASWTATVDASKMKSSVASLYLMWGNAIDCALERIVLNTRQETCVDWSKHAKRASP